MDSLCRAARWRAFGLLGLEAGVPMLAALAALARLAGPGAALALGLVSLAGFSALAWRRLGGYDRRWLATRLDERCAVLEDSSALALGLVAAPGGLQRLQQTRIQTRLESLNLPDLRPAAVGSRLIWAASASGVLAVVAVWGPLGLERLRQGLAPEPPGSENRVAGVAGVAGVEGRLLATPPAYTGSRPIEVDGLEASVPAGSSLRWALRIDPAVESAALVFHDGERLELSARAGLWQGERDLAESTLYRLETGAGEAQADRGYRIDLIPDSPPQIAVRVPKQTLTVLEDGQRSWDLEFEARDDYRLGEASLSITLAQGSGEQIAVSEQTLELQGEGGARERRYRQTLDLEALGFARGDDLIVRLTVADNREPEPNLSRSASFILRAPAEAWAQGEGVEGLVNQTLPAYFRSQRQIIIDSEALLAERAALAPEAYVDQADAIGVDQKVLRLRYGQFLGEEFEPASHPPPSSSEPGHSEGDGHDHGADDLEPEAGRTAGFGAGGDEVLAEFGHLHDIREAATLLDPETRRILKAALDEMWQAEGQLRLGNPEAALPYEYKALEYIKQVQQASRIYLARTGADLPELDLTRRLSGDRSELGDRVLPLHSRTDEASPLPSLWRLLQSADEPALLAGLKALEDWLDGAPIPANAGLNLLQASTELRRDPACEPCKENLEAQIWPLLPQPATVVLPRAASGNEPAQWMQNPEASAGVER